MMSDLPGEMTKQIFEAPARTIRSTRYSLTAFGRSVRSSERPPTGSNSFENASGWIRVPFPAAGITPHISFSRQKHRACRCGADAVQQRHEFTRPMLGRVLRKHALARRMRDPERFFLR